jgi:hypothetical protein
MRWIRAKLRFSAWCALFALALQFAFSFGHVHAPGPKKGLLLAQLVVPPSADAPGAPAKPTKPLRQIAHDQCVVCGSMQLASGMILAAGLLFLLRTEPAPIWFNIHTDLVLAASPHDSFRARAPPQV